MADSSAVRPRVPGSSRSDQGSQLAAIEGRPNWSQEGATLPAFLGTGAQTIIRRDIVDNMIDALPNL